MNYTITIPDYIYNFSEIEINNKYLKDTLIQKIFFNNNFIKTTNIDLDISNQMMEYLLLIFNGKMIIPQKEEREEFSNLLDFLAYKSKAFYKYSKLIRSKQLMDFFGKKCYINDIIPFDMIELIYEYNIDHSNELNENIKNYIYNKHHIRYFTLCNNIFDENGLNISLRIKSTYYLYHNNTINKEYDTQIFNYIISKINDIYNIIDNMTFDTNKDHFHKETFLLI